MQMDGIHSYLYSFRRIISVFTGREAILFFSNTCHMISVNASLTFHFLYPKTKRVLEYGHGDCVFFAFPCMIFVFQHLLGWREASSHLIIMWHWLSPFRTNTNPATPRACFHCEQSTAIIYCALPEGSWSSYNMKLSHSQLLSGIMLQTGLGSSHGQTEPRWGSLCLWEFSSPVDVLMGSSLFLV